MVVRFTPKARRPFLRLVETQVTHGTPELDAQVIDFYAEKVKRSKRLERNQREHKYIDESGWR